LRIEQLFSCFFLWLTVSANAQLTSKPATPQESILYEFTGGASDGYFPFGLTIDRKGNLFGTTAAGLAGDGTVFELRRDSDGSWNEDVLYDFSRDCCVDGATPDGKLVFDASGNLYGTTELGGGSTGGGTVFKLTRTGNEWIGDLLYSFLFGSTSNGYYPIGGVVFDRNGNLYGTTLYGGGEELCNGDYGCGTVYELTPGAAGIWAHTLLYSFSGGDDGANPLAGLALDGSGNLYGTTSLAGAHGDGTIFELTPNSAGTWDNTVLHAFTGGADGATPSAPLTFGPDGNLYGTTENGGAYGYGNVFQLTRGGSGVWQEKVLHQFTNGSDGASPQSGLIFDSKGNIYGTAWSGGNRQSDGVVFELVKSADSYVENVLYSFPGGAGGQNPNTQLVFDQVGNLYGTVPHGGTTGKGCLSGCGFVYEIIP
jgi:uncharacterized repeat protein (TIGR03803 family)